MTPTVDRTRPDRLRPDRAWRAAALLSAALWGLSLALPVANVMRHFEVGGWRMLLQGWRMTPSITVAWLANPAWLALELCVLLRGRPPTWLAWLTPALALASLVFWDVLGPGACVWLLSFAPWPWTAVALRRR